jgi:hypothetical protein
MRIFHTICSQSVIFTARLLTFTFERITALASVLSRGEARVNGSPERKAACSMLSLAVFRSLLRLIGRTGRLHRRLEANHRMMALGVSSGIFQPPQERIFIAGKTLSTLNRRSTDAV